MQKVEENVIEIKQLVNRYIEITVIGDSDLILNKMNDIDSKKLIDKRKDKAKDVEKADIWESIITS